MKRFHVIDKNKAVLGTLDISIELSDRVKDGKSIQLPCMEQIPTSIDFGSPASTKRTIKSIWFSPMRMVSEGGNEYTILVANIDEGIDMIYGFEPA